MKTKEEYEKSSSGNIHPPDGGWGWVIVFSAFFCNFLVDGVTLSFGVMLPMFSEQFQAPESKVAFAGSVMVGSYSVAAPVVSGLVNQFGSRVIIIFGSILAAAGFVISSFSPNLDVLIVTYGVLGGVGLGMIYIPSIVSVGYYFKKKRSLAMSIAVCGSGVGVFVLAPVFELLLDIYDWRNFLLITAGIVLNGAIFGMLMRPLHLSKTKLSMEVKEKTARYDKRKSESIFTIENKRENDISSAENDLKLCTVKISDDCNSKRKTKNDKKERAISNLQSISEAEAKMHITENSVSEAKPNKSKHKIAHRSMTKDVEKYRKLTIYQTITCFDKCSFWLRSAGKYLKTTIGFGLLFNIPFSLSFCVGNFFALIGFFVPYEYIVDKALLLGISSTKSSFLLSIIGITNTLGRVMAGILASFKGCNTLVLHNVSLAMLSVTLFLEPFCNSYSLLVVFCVAFGICVGAFISLTPIVLFHFLGLERFATGYGWVVFARGISSVLGPPLAGMVIEATGSYDVSYYFGGGMFLCALLFHLILHFPCVKRLSKSNVPTVNQI